MAFCAKCGSQVADGVGFCPKCGAPQPAAAGPVPGGAPKVAASGETGMQENVAGLLCYVLGWLTGLIFFLIDKRPFVRFHAAQSMVIFGALFIVRIVLGFATVASPMHGLGGWAFASMLYGLVGLLALVLWILCMVKAYQHEKFRVPLAADLADQLAGK
jgi:uncharacterized membrane protein